MSCHGKTDFKANDESLTWQEFKALTLELGTKRNDPNFDRYLLGVTDNAWSHVLSENFLTPKTCEQKLWGFYNSDVKK